MVLDPPPLEDEKVADRDIRGHGTARQDIHKTATDLGEHGSDPSKAVRIL